MITFGIQLSLDSATIALIRELAARPQPQPQWVTDIITHLHNQEKQMAAIDDAIDALTQQVQNNTTVIGSAKTLIAGFSQRLDDAVAAAKAQGATPAQLQALSDLSTAVKNSDDDLAAAIQSNTPSAPPAQRAT